MTVHPLTETAHEPVDFLKALDQVRRQERVLVVLYTLGIEYEAKTISAERYANRVVHELAELMKPEVKPA